MSHKTKSLPYISDHELNRHDGDAIVYRDVNGEIIRLTVDDFSSPEEFLKWKEWSDESYAEIDHGDRQYYDHKLPLFDQDCPTQSIEEDIFGVEERTQREAEEEKLIAAYLRTLTPTQARRFVMYHYDNMTLEEIAVEEGVGFQRIARSLELCKKKIIKFNCKLSVNTGGKMGVFSALSERGIKPSQNLENLIDSVKGTKPA